MLGHGPVCLCREEVNGKDRATDPTAYQYTLFTSVPLPRYIGNGLRLSVSSVLRQFYFKQSILWGIFFSSQTIAVMKRHQA